MDNTNQCINDNRDNEKIELDNCFSKLNDKIAMYALKIAENKAELDEAKISVKNADKNTK
tara:strand:- start:98 stop:277 length:180 start_codon:yes stop_codon:yes gene_type:complete